MLRIILSLLVTVMTVGCTRWLCEDYGCYPYPSEGRCKPKAVLIPVIETSKIDCLLDPGQDITKAIADRIAFHRRLYLMPQLDVEFRIQQMGKVDFSTNESIIANNFREADYVILVEVSVEGCNAACTIIGSYPYRELQLKARVKVIDVRDGDTPRFDERKLVSDSYIARPDLVLNNGTCLQPRTNAYKRSSFGKAQQNLINDIVETIETDMHTLSSY